MTKAERRKRARARAREREQAQVAPDALEKAVEAVEAAPAPDPGAVVAEAEAESEFITGPVAARSAAVDRRPVRGTTLGGELIADRHRRMAAEAAEADDDEDEGDDEDDDLITGDDDDDGDEDDDEELDEQEDALFEIACAAVEQGNELSWQEFVGLLLTAEVTDPRLALMVGLVMEGAPEGETPEKHVPLPLTGERVLDMLKAIELGELVEEAREVAALSPGDPEDTADERELVRTNARKLNELSKRELAKGSRGQTGERERGRPLRASDVRARRTALSSGAMNTRSRG